MADTVWFQIGGLFGKILHHSVLFLVFTVFTSIMYFFFAISFQTPLKNPARRAGGRKPEAYNPNFDAKLNVLIIQNEHLQFV